MPCDDIVDYGQAQTDATASRAWLTQATEESFLESTDFIIDKPETIIPYFYDCVIPP